MKIYNSLTNKIEEFTPIDNNNINMYVCGPTVNKRTHLGHLYPAIFFDTVYRYFKYCGYNIKYASNFTDIDDKIIASSIEQNKTEKEIAEYYANLYLEDLKNVNCLPVDYRPRVTEYIDDIIEFIGILLEKGFAYKNGSDIYLNVKKINDYGMLSNQKIDDLEYGNRINVDTNKENPYDFVLWKSTDKGIKWNAPFGIGRPGWHTECVVMINKIFGGKIDIHGGGVDLKFPHHENEIAQSLAAWNNTLATYWMHNGHLMLDGIKMSKSLGNVIILDDLLNKYNANVIRLSMLKNRYRLPLSLTETLFDESSTIDEKITNILKNLNLYIQVNDLEIIKNENNKIKEYMNDDFNTSNLITYMLDIIKELNNALRTYDEITIVNNYQILLDITNILGLKYDLKTLSQEDKDLYNKWIEYRKNKDYENADKIRNKLAKKGII